MISKEPMTSPKLMRWGKLFKVPKVYLKAHIYIPPFNEHNLVTKLLIKNSITPGKWCQHPGGVRHPLLFLFCFFLLATVHGIMVPQPRIEFMLPAVEAQSTNCWTARPGRSQDVLFFVSLLSQLIRHPWTNVPLWELWGPAPYAEKPRMSLVHLCILW